VTAPYDALRESDSSEIVFPEVAGNETAVFRLDIPGDVFAIRPPAGQAEALVCLYDLEVAQIIGGEVTASWSDPDILISAHRLRPLVSTAERILQDVFGPNASLTPEIGNDPDARGPLLVLKVRIERQQRDLRDAFLNRYVRETVLPHGAPVPALIWEYRRAVPA
jgi:hypothetical protein